MANTVYHYAPKTWVNGTDAANATNLNHLETGPLDAISSLNPDLWTAFVLSGITCTKDGTNANQLDIAAGRAYVTQTDGTRALIAVAADNTHTTTLPSVTYYLYLQPDGTWYWNTVNSGYQVNSLFIAQVTTDGSSNILAVTDERVLNTTLLSGMAGELVLPALAPIASIGGQASGGGFGVPVVLNPVVFRQHITTTTQTTIATVTPPTTAMYRVQGCFSLNNGTSGQKVTFGINFTDPDTNILTTQYLAVIFGAGAATVLLLEGGLMTTTLQNAGYATTPWVVTTTTAGLTVLYGDIGGTPNDHVSVVIERLA